MMNPADAFRSADVFDKETWGYPLLIGKLFQSYLRMDISKAGAMLEGCMTYVGRAQYDQHFAVFRPITVAGPYALLDPLVLS